MIKKILIDNGHAKSTPGKCSPDKSFYEWEWNREIALMLQERLTQEGIESVLLVPEYDKDIPLRERAARANAYGKDTLFISIHANAAGNGSWMQARGWSAFTSKGYTKSDEYCEIFVREAIKVLEPLGQKVRKYSSKKYGYEENFTVLVKTIMPAILTESMFYDNKEDLKFLKSEEGKKAIVDIHVNAIKRILGKEDRFLTEEPCDCS